MSETKENRFLKVSWAGRTDRGHRRKVNEDRLILIPEMGVYGVADGIGGGDAGDYASGQVASYLQKRVMPMAGWSSLPELDDLTSVVVEALSEANAVVRVYGQENQFKYCGSTVVLLLLDHHHPDRARVIHAGDSRLYCLRGSDIQSLTLDHNARNEYDDTILKKLQPHQHTHITRAVGLREELEVVVTDVEVQAGDRYLLCTDGLYGMHPLEQLEQEAGWSMDLSVDEAAELLLRLALDGGGKDNVSLVLVDPMPTAEHAPVFVPAVSEAEMDDAPHSPAVAVSASPELSETPMGASPVDMPAVALADATRSVNEETRFGKGVFSPLRAWVGDHRLTAVMTSVGLVLFAALVFGGVGIYDAMLAKNVEFAMEEFDKVDRQGSLEMRVQELSTLLDRTSPMFQRDFRKQRWAPFEQAVQEEIADLNNRVQEAYTQALDGITMAGPDKVFFEVADGLIELDTSLRLAPFSGWGKANHQDRRSMMRGMTRMIRLWDFLHSIKEPDVREEIDRAERLLGEIQLLREELGEGEQAFLQRLSENPYMSGMAIDELAQEHVDQLRERYRQCATELVRELCQVPGMEAEVLLEALLDPVHIDTETRESSLVVANEQRLQRRALVDQLARYEVTLSDPEHFGDAVDFLVHTYERGMELDEAVSEGEQP